MLRKSWLLSLLALCALGCAQSGSKPQPAAEHHVAKEAQPPSVPAFEKMVGAVTGAVNDWAAAWASRDIPRYLAAYAPDFSPEHGTRAEWEKQRKERISKAARLSVTVSELQVTSYSPGRATASFVQSYESENHSDKSKKTLELRDAGGHWLITREYTR